MSQQKYVYAGFWRRAVAALIDNVLLLLVTAPLLLFFYGTTYFEALSDPYEVTPFVAGPADFLISWILPLVIVVVFWKACGATPGKIWLGMKIVDTETGGALSINQCIGRYLGYFLYEVPLWLGIYYEKPGFFAITLLGIIKLVIDKKKQGWHDKLAGTAVIMTHKQVPVEQLSQQNAAPEPVADKSNAAHERTQHPVVIVHAPGPVADKGDDAPAADVASESSDAASDDSPAVEAWRDFLHTNENNEPPARDAASESSNALSDSPSAVDAWRDFWHPDKNNDLPAPDVASEASDAAISDSSPATDAANESPADTPTTPALETAYAIDLVEDEQNPAIAVIDDSRNKPWFTLKPTEGSDQLLIDGAAGNVKIGNTEGWAEVSAPVTVTLDTLVMFGDNQMTIRDLIKSHADVAVFYEKKMKPVAVRTKRHKIRRDPETGQIVR